MNYLSDVRTVFRHAFRMQSTRLTVANYSKFIEPKGDAIYNEDEEERVKVEDLLVSEEEDTTARAKEIERMRNKSRLNKTHRNLLFNQPKPLDEYKWDQTVYFNRKQFGHYGSASGVDPRLCFYTPAEVADKAEFERVSYPLTIQEMAAMIKEEKAEKARQIREREEKIAGNMTKLDKWMQDLNDRIQKKEQDARLAKQKREAMLDDIRQELGFKIDFRDPRFKALMEKKEEEAKKAKKAEKKKKREALAIEKIKQQAEITLEQAKKTKGDDQSKDEKDAKKKDEDEPGSDSDSDSDDKKDTKKK